MDERPVRTVAERRLGYLRVLEARSPSTSVERLSVLATDEIRPVRLWTARNWNTPPEALSTLAQDEDETVRWNTLLNPRTPADALQAMAQQEAATAPANWFVVRHRVVHHPNTDSALREELFAAGACAGWLADRCVGFRPYRRRALT
ncbi:hypothetical protein [Dactylosporangium sp. NPDC000521]|uniref:hypothetical protein n=1 Tax=Dactylosporangium sp. NPDC000521 TaxID=3363975 RepID=UPI0036BB8DF7